MERRRIVCDAKLCTGCRLCEFACSLTKERQFALELSRIRIVQAGLGQTTATLCRFCRNLSCVNACPRQALTYSADTATIELDKGRCAGCGWCIEACPFGAMVLDGRTKTVAVCDVCYGLSEPACVELCPQKALTVQALNKA